jgi:hypothetical protein
MCRNSWSFISIVSIRTRWRGSLSSCICWRPSSSLMIANSRNDWKLSLQKYSINCLSVQVASSLIVSISSTLLSMALMLYASRRRFTRWSSDTSGCVRKATWRICHNMRSLRSLRKKTKSWQATSSSTNKHWISTKESFNSWKTAFSSKFPSSVASRARTTKMKCQPSCATWAKTYCSTPTK